MLVCYPVPGRSWNYVWYRPVLSDADLQDLCTDAAGRHHGPAIPPPLVRVDVAAKLKEAARALLAPRLAAVVQHTQPFFQAIYDVETPRIAAGRVALLGDAAFVARPHVGMGVTKAALDAACLARSLEIHGDVEQALRRYAGLRGQFGRQCVARGRQLGAYIEARARPHLAWAPEALDQRPERVLREIGATMAEIPELQLGI
jgi:2-polyprenyl-6-methoxyphenol hydroxylase-like FAD-dependent oxidoreductase